MKLTIVPSVWWMLCCCLVTTSYGIDFETEVRPLLAKHCHKCHGLTTQEAGLRLDARKFAFTGSEQGVVIVPGMAERSSLFQRVATAKAEERMPPEGAALNAAEVATIQKWINEGAKWEENELDRAAMEDPRRNHWAWSVLKPVAIPQLTPEQEKWCRNNVDRFILQKMVEKGLSPSPVADRRTLIRRVYFDLIGLPPTPEQVSSFVNDADPLAYERVVDELLASSQYGERWARHWLDVVRYADTHGYDKDQPRPHAWPYRDYVIRALNTDKPYARFVQEQIAGDVLYPNTGDGMEALGFIAAGPWDLIGHAEVPETKIDGKIARLLDRDDMVSNTMNTFASITVQCARCHDHKFDPVSQGDYYSLQAVFAALDRAPKAYDSDPQLAARRSQLTANKEQLTAQIAAWRKLPPGAAAERLAKLDQRLAQLAELKPGTTSRAAAYGYHSQLAPKADTVKWVQIDLGKSAPLSKVVLQPAYDDFGNIGAGFGFPVRFKIELSDDSTFEKEVVLLADYTAADFANPKLQSLEIAVNLQPARYVRVTATQLALRTDVYIFALAEMQIFNADGENVATKGTVTALDSIEASPRWGKTNLNDHLYPGEKLSSDPAELKRLTQEREALFEKSLDEKTRQSLAQAILELQQVEKELTQLPPLKMVYAGTVYRGTGTFRGTGAEGGKPREIRVFKRGDVREPRELVEPGTLSLVPELAARFALPPTAPEGERRAALARWLTDVRNPLPWRSIVNRVWLYHFGRGLVDSPNDFGRMGQSPSHPELLDWLAGQFRDEGQSLKQLHRLLVTSATYRQSSQSQANKAALDSGNVYLWRMQRRRLEAEAIRDAVLAVAGKLNNTAGGPGFQDFVIEHPAHSPHYSYHLSDPQDERSHRRSIYRLIVRSQPQPFLTILDCADPAMSVDKRNESLTPLQALALLNNRFMLTMADHFSQRLAANSTAPDAQIRLAFQKAFQRDPTPVEQQQLASYAQQHGLSNACRLLFNMSEFVFID
jgi:Protein of unknown function (DUF1553)/Protein of unknown function (DUF1549)/Planctomycete cytochrome C/F5/8 type C domain